MTCASCKYWQPESGPLPYNGDCRYNPPVVLPNGAVTTPRTPNTYWCGKYEANVIQSNV